MDKKQNNIKIIITIIILSLALISAYAVPRITYSGTGFISNLKVPLSFADWKGTDIKDTLNLDFENNWNRFISGTLINNYINSEDSRVVFIILDAGNFHHPNVCFTASGYEIKEMGITNFNLKDRTISARTLYTKKEDESNFSFYWIIIDKKIVDNWIEQKIKQLYFSLFNRDRVGLMVRIDVPAKETDLEHAALTAQNFLNDLMQTSQLEQAEYIIGSN